MPHEVREEAVQGESRAPSVSRVSVYKTAEIFGVTVDTIKNPTRRGRPHTKVTVTAGCGCRWTPAVLYGTTTGTITERRRPKSWSRKCANGSATSARCLARSGMLAEERTRSLPSLSRPTPPSPSGCPSWNVAQMGTSKAPPHGRSEVHQEVSEVCTERTLVAEDDRGMNPRAAKTLDHSTVGGRTLRWARTKHCRSIRGGKG